MGSSRKEDKEYFQSNRYVEMRSGGAFKRGGSVEKEQSEEVEEGVDRKGLICRGRDREELVFGAQTLTWRLVMEEMEEEVLVPGDRRNNVRMSHLCQS